MRVCVFVLGLLAIAVPASAEQLVIDLADGVSSVTVRRSPGTAMTFVVRNRLPKGLYQVSVETRGIPIPPLEIEDVGTAASSDPCAPLLNDVTKVYEVTDERALAQHTAPIRKALADSVCTHNPGLVDRLRQTLSDTEIAVDGEYTVRAGEEIVVTVSRADKAWVRIISGGARGKWLATYGASVIQDRSQRMFAKPNGSNAFVITPETEPVGPRVVPSIYFTWMSARAEGRDWTQGPTAGLGIDKASPSIFAGWSVTYNHNLTFIAGAALAQHKRLRGKYQPGDIVSEALDEGQLLEGAYRPTAQFAIAFRFGDNPFGKPAEEPKAGGKDGAGKKN